MGEFFVDGEIFVELFEINNPSEGITDSFILNII